MRDAFANMREVYVKKIVKQKLNVSTGEREIGFSNPPFIKTKGIPKNQRRRCNKCGRRGHAKRTCR